MLAYIHKFNEIMNLQLAHAEAIIVGTSFVSVTLLLDIW
jgi:hypothetical protein